MQANQWSNPLKTSRSSDDGSVLKPNRQKTVLTPSTEVRRRTGLLRDLRPGSASRTNRGLAARWLEASSRVLNPAQLSRPPQSLVATQGVRPGPVLRPAP